MQEKENKTMLTSVRMAPELNQKIKRVVIEESKKRNYTIVTQNEIICSLLEYGISEYNKGMVSLSEV